MSLAEYFLHRIMVIMPILESIGTLFMVITTIVAIPLTIFTFYLRSLREQHQSWQRELVRQISIVESAIPELRKEFSDLERDYTNKEEWLRESMYARQTIQQLLESVARIETVMGSPGNPLSNFGLKHSLQEEIGVCDPGKLNPVDNRREGSV